MKPLRVSGLVSLLHLQGMGKHPLTKVTWRIAFCVQGPMGQYGELLTHKTLNKSLLGSFQTQDQTISLKDQAHLALRHEHFHN